MQQEIKYTQGPWDVMESKTLLHVETANLGDGSACGIPICSLPKKAAGNARLIAAAPELLYALERLMKEIPSRRDWLDPDTEKLARHAVDKAQGKI